MFVMSRVYMLQSAYETHAQQRKDETWLLQQCENDEFYHNMRQHSQLCDTVSRNAQSILFMTALQSVLEQTYLCGYDPCETIIDRIATWLFGRGLPILLLVLLIVVLMPTLLLPMLRKQMNIMADQHMRELYNTPYGIGHYKITSGAVYSLES